MRRKIYTLLFTLITFTLITSCGKSKDPQPATKTDFLVAHPWQGDQVLVSGIDVSKRSEVTSQIGQIKTVKLNFNRNGTYNATYTTDAGPQAQTGNWKFNSDETKLTFELYGEVEIKTLTENNLDMTAKIPFQGVLFDAEVKFIK